jgi:hypothetical protein
MNINDHLIEEAQANMVRIQGEFAEAQAKYWAVSKCLRGDYDGSTNEQYEDMMRQFTALSAMRSCVSCIKSIKADISKWTLENAA